MSLSDSGYIVIDGSYLLMSIQQFWKDHPEAIGHKLKVSALSDWLIGNWNQYVRSTIRVVFYFKPHDSRVDRWVDVPDISVPGSKNHWEIVECGQSNDSIPDDVLLALPQKYRDLMPRKEKGVDMQLACDTLIHLANGTARNFVFLVNDRDYIPLFHAIHNLGGNTYLTGLDRGQFVRQELLTLSDYYRTAEEDMDQLFGLEKAKTPTHEVVPPVSSVVETSVTQETKSS